MVSVEKLRGASFRVAALPFRRFSLMLSVRRFRPRKDVVFACIAVCAMAANGLAEWNEKVLYSFQGGNDGQTPSGGLVFDTQGNLYGVTSAGGSGSCSGFFPCGTVYELSPPTQKGGAWTKTTIHNFQGYQQGDGSSPSGTLVIDKAGNLYGATGYGGTGDCVVLGAKEGCGTVYEMIPPPAKGQWAEKILYSFKGGNDGFVAGGGLVFDTAGNLYGVTAFGGGKGTSCDSLYGGQCGTVFELSPPKLKGGQWTEKVLHSFAGIASGKQYGDGANPDGRLLVDGNGAIYGTTYTGGYDCPHSSNQGCGTMFKLTAPATAESLWPETFLHVSKGIPDATGPTGGLVFHGGGLYGATEGGGTGISGTVFKLTPTRDGSWAERLLYSFKDGNDGALPTSGVVFDGHGDMYGTATAGGASGGGTLFELRPAGGGWSFEVLHTFTGSPDGLSPGGILVLSGSNIIGTAGAGGTGTECHGGCGVVFQAKAQ